MNIKIIDDCQADADRLKWLCNLYFKQDKRQAGATEPVYEILTSYCPDMDLTADLLFLDIEMPGTNGIALKNALEKQSCMREKEPHPYIIFVTGYEEYMPDAFGKYVIAFLQKPVKIHELELALDRVMMQLESRQTVDCGNGTCVYTQKIRYIRTNDHIYTALHLDAGEHLTRRSLKEWQNLLGDETFCRISNQVIVNLQWVKDVRGSVVHLHGSDECLTVSRRRMNTLHDALKCYREKDIRYL